MTPVISPTQRMPDVPYQIHQWHMVFHTNGTQTALLQQLHHLVLHLWVALGAEGRLLNTIYSYAQQMIKHCHTLLRHENTADSPQLLVQSSDKWRGQDNILYPSMFHWASIPLSLNQGSVPVSEGHQYFSTRVGKQGLHQAFDANNLPWRSNAAMANGFVLELGPCWYFLAWLPTCNKKCHQKLTLGFWPIDYQVHPAAVSKSAILGAPALGLSDWIAHQAVLRW